jgi:hypothetical protein
MRHINTSSARSALLIAILGAAGVLADPVVTHAAPPQDLVFKPETIVGDRNHYEKIKTQLQIANTIVMDYLRDSTKAVEQGHRLALANFEVWYRHFQSRKEDATREIMEVVMKNVLTRGLEIVFPEGTPFIEALKFVAEKGYEVAVQNLAPQAAGDVDGFLAQLKVVEETYISKLLDTPEQFRQTHADAFEAAQWEIVNLWIEGTGAPSNPTMPASAIEILTAVGVPAPGSQTATAVGESVLVSHIAPIYKNTPSIVQGAGPFSLDAMAQVAALRQFDLNGNKQRICRIERRSFSSFFWSVPRGECDLDR